MRHSRERDGMIRLVFFIKKKRGKGRNVFCSDASILLHLRVALHVRDAWILSGNSTSDVTATIPSLRAATSSSTSFSRPLDEPSLLLLLLLLFYIVVIVVSSRTFRVC